MKTIATAFGKRDPEALRLAESLPSLPPVRGHASRRKQALRHLGQHLAAAVRQKLGAKYKGELAVVCAAEDADGLAHGVVQALEQAGLAAHVHLFCHWTRQRTLQGETLATIAKEYREPFPARGGVLLLVTPLLEQVAPLRAQLSRALEGCQPSHILLLAPLAENGVAQALQQQFPAKLAEKISLLSFATLAVPTTVSATAGSSTPTASSPAATTTAPRRRPTPLSFNPQLVQSRRAERFRVAATVG